MIHAKATIKINYCKDYMKKIENSLPKAMEHVMQKSKQSALSKKRGSKEDNLILYELTKNGEKFEGRLYTNFDYALFLEFGTGIKAEMPHIGHTETFKKSGYTYWFLPKELADAKGKEFAPQRVINIKGNLYYIMFSTQPFPFMRPTAFEMETSVLDDFVEVLRKELK